MLLELACVCVHALKRANTTGLINFNSKVLVQGLGPVGTFAVMYLKRMGVKKVYAITAGNNLKREELAVSLGADKVFNLTREGTENVTKALFSENGGLGVDLCFEASGAPQAVVQGMEILRNRGIYLVPGQYSASGGIEIQPQIITFKALHIIGSSQYSMIDVHKYLEFLDGNPDLHPLIEKLGSKYKVEQINEAIVDAKSGNNIKTLLVK
jgi:L-iditol 2-dehydrogenase